AVQLDWDVGAHVLVVISSHRRGYSLGPRRSPFIASRRPSRATVRGCRAYASRHLLDCRPRFFDGRVGRGRSIALVLRRERRVVGEARRGGGGDAVGGRGRARATRP